MRLFGLFAAALLLFSISSASAATDPIRIGAGKKGGGYDAAATQLCTGLRKNNIDCEVVNFDGSEDIVNALMAESIDYGVSQPDVPFLLNVSPQRTAKMFEEVGVLACNQGSDISELTDLGEDNTVVVGPIGSGGALTWDGMIRSEKDGAWKASDWIEAKPIYMDLVDGVLNVEDGEADCIFAVARSDSSTFKSWQESDLVFADIDDGDVDDLERNGESVYPIEERDVHGNTVDVIVLPASLYRSVDAEAKSEQALTLLRRLVRSVR